MGSEKIAYRLLVIYMILTIISGKVEVPLIIRYANSIVLICISSYYLILSVIRFLNSDFSALSADRKDKISEFSSEVSFFFTSAILAIIQTVHSSEVLTAIKILVILNGVYSIYLNVWVENKKLTFKHYVITFLLIGVGVFIPVS